MTDSPYAGKPQEEWAEITQGLVTAHPISGNQFVTAVLGAWEDVLNGSFGSFKIGRDIFLSPQSMGVLLHELVPLHLMKITRGRFRPGALKTEKDIHCTEDNRWSVEIKCSSHKDNIFANRSYGQKNSTDAKKNKDGYYLAINFDKQTTDTETTPRVRLIRLGYLDHADWSPQSAATGQNSTLPKYMYSSRFVTLFTPQPR